MNALFPRLSPGDCVLGKNKNSFVSMLFEERIAAY